MAQRRGNIWLALTGLGLLLYVVAEVAALIWVAGEIGWWTLLILLGSSLIGIFLLQREWKKAWGALSESLRTGQLPSGQLADATLILIGGILLLLPGLLSDIAGLSSCCRSRGRSSAPPSPGGPHGRSSATAWLRW